MSSEWNWQGAKNILCVRLDSLGDVLMTSPAIRALKETQPDRIIALLTSSAGAGVAPLLDEIDQTIVYNAPWMKASAPALHSEPELQVIERLKRPNFDAAIVFTTFSQNPLPAAHLAFLADIPLRLAYCRENPYQLLTHWVPESDVDGGFAMRHEVRRQLDIVSMTGSVTADESIRLHVGEAAMERAHRLLADAGIDIARPWLIVHPGASAPSRRYPAESFATAAQQLADQYDFQIVFTGTGREAGLIEIIRERMRAPSFSLAGKLSVEALAAVISLAPLLISNNTGPVHIAAGVQTPVVTLYALTNPQHTPWMLPHRTLYHEVPCSFCYKSICPMGHHNCLRLVPPQAVVEAALSLLAEVAARSTA